MPDGAGKGMGGLRALGALVLLLVCAACPFTQSQRLAGYQRDIDDATRSIAAARDDGERAMRYAERGRAYSEKARYSRAFKLITVGEYDRLFGLAIEDHDHAIALRPDDAGVYLSRGLTHYDRATVIDPADQGFGTALGMAAVDFTSTLERDPRNGRALDMRGVVLTSSGDLDRAIDDFALEMAVDPHLGRLRLTEAYCSRGSVHHRAGDLDLAIPDYQKAIDLGSSGDGCDCQPETPLAWIYYEKKEYDRSWEVVRRARATGRWIDRELLLKLKQATASVG